MPANVIELTANYREEHIHHALIFVDIRRVSEAGFLRRLSVC